jgi:hypothetical protein
MLVQIIKILTCYISDFQHHTNIFTLSGLFIFVSSFIHGSYNIRCGGGGGGIGAKRVKVSTGILGNQKGSVVKLVWKKTGIVIKLHT